MSVGRLETECELPTYTELPSLVEDVRPPCYYEITTKIRFAFSSLRYEEYSICVRSQMTMLGVFDPCISYVVDEKKLHKIYVSSEDAVTAVISLPEDVDTSKKIRLRYCNGFIKLLLRKKQPQGNTLSSKRERDGQGSFCPIMLPGLPGLVGLPGL